MKPGGGVTRLPGAGDPAAASLVEGFRRLGPTFYGLAAGELPTRWLEAGGERGTASFLCAAGGPGGEGSPRLLVVPPGRDAELRLRRLLRSLEPGALAGLSLLVFRWRTARRLRNLVGRRAGRDPAIYGLDPDYFFAVVPLVGTASRCAQRYVLDLKPRDSRRDAWKHRARRLLVACGIFGPLYPGFLLVMRPAP